jgi:hypothetical protein
MRIHVHIKPGSKRESLQWDGERIIARVAAPPIEGAANQKLIENLAEWLRISKSQIRITSGHTARYKALEIDAPDELIKAAIDQLEKQPHQDRLL